MKNNNIDFEDYLIQQPVLLKQWWQKKGEKLFLGWVYKTQFYTKRELKIRGSK